MERVRSPTAELSRDLSALRLCQLTPVDVSDNYEIPSDNLAASITTATDHTDNTCLVVNHEHSPNQQQQHKHFSTKEEEKNDLQGIDGCEQDTLLLRQLQSLTVSTHQLSSLASTSQYHVTRRSHEWRRPCIDTSGPVQNTGGEDHTQWAWSRGSHGNGRCRDEALGVVRYVDDVTVDDLAGYFDQMLHLPKPMSEMAQLMYT